MKNNEKLTNLALDLLKDAVLNQSRINVTDSLGIINTYDDANSQRGAYLSFWGYTNQGINLEAPHDYSKNSFFVRRRLTFTNKGDEGKEDAILLTIHGDYIANAKNIDIKNDCLIIDGLHISIWK